jgi:hypothetical protein
MNAQSKKLTIVISLKHLVIGAVVVILLILGFAGLYLRKKVKDAREQCLNYYHKSGSDLRYELSKDPAISENKIKISRYLRGFKILKNNSFDYDVIAYDFRVVDSNEMGLVLVIRYVDELLRVAQVNYAYDIDPNSFGSAFISSEDMPSPHMRMHGKTDMCIPLRVDLKLSANEIPYYEWNGERWLLFVPKTTFDDIIKKEGQFILLNKEGNVLDRFGLKELSHN